MIKTKLEIDADYSSMLAIVAQEATPGLSVDEQEYIKNALKEWAEPKYLKELLQVTDCLLGKKKKYSKRVLEIVEGLNTWTKSLARPKKRMCSTCHGTGWITK